MDLHIEIDREENGRRIAEVPGLSGYAYPNRQTDRTSA